VALTRTHGRVRSALVSVILAAVAALLLPVWAAAAPGDPSPPTVASVRTKLDTLARQTEVLAEKYNKAQINVAAARQAADTARRTAGSATAQFEAARRQFASEVATRYQGSTFSNTGALLSSSNGAGYLDTLNTLDLLSKEQADVVDGLIRAKTAADGARNKADTLLADAATKRKAVTEQRSKAAAETAKYQTLLDTLTAAQQAAYNTRQAATPAQAATVQSVHAGSAAAQRAVDFALAQVGKPYVFAAAGPDAFDCSGLTMAAWAAGGVSLPHLASAQYDYGTHVSANQLQPGDLVFLYQPIDHVAIYIGNGMMVSAPQPGENVQIVPFANFASDFSGATRLA
jgi:peptidoglycan DL-endopeptidase CwlO